MIFIGDRGYSSIFQLYDLDGVHEFQIITLFMPFQYLAIQTLYAQFKKFSQYEFPATELSASIIKSIFEFRTWITNKYMYICTSIQLWVVSKKMCGKLCELMLKNLLPAVSPFFLEKKTLKNVRSIQILQDCQMFIIVFVKTSVNHFFSGFIFPLKKITSITISRVVQPNI